MSKLTEEQKQEIAKKIVEILPHVDGVHGSLSTRQTKIPTENLENLFKYVVDLVEKRA